MRKNVELIKDNNGKNEKKSVSKFRNSEFWYERYEYSANFILIRLQCVLNLSILHTFYHDFSNIKSLIY